MAFPVEFITELTEDDLEKERKEKDTMADDIKAARDGDLFDRVNAKALELEKRKHQIETMLDENNKAFDEERQRHDELINELNADRDRLKSAMERTIRDLDHLYGTLHYLKRVRYE